MKKKNSGGQRFLDEGQQASLETAPPADGGLWTSLKVAAWISDHIFINTPKVLAEVSHQPMPLLCLAPL